MKTGGPQYTSRTWKTSVAAERMELGKEWCEMKLENSAHTGYDCQLENAGEPLEKWQESDRNDRSTRGELVSWLEVKSTRIITIQTLTLQGEERWGRDTGLGVRAGLVGFRPA